MAVNKNNDDVIGGRPTKYRPEYGEQASKLIALGAGIEELADFFGVHRETIYAWKRTYPERFSDKIEDAQAKQQKEDIESVKASLLNRALGKAKTKKVKQYVGEDGKKVGSKEIVIIEHPPEVKAIQYYLNNKDPENWKNRLSNEHTGADGEPIEHVHLDKEEYAETRKKMLEADDC